MKQGYVYILTSRNSELVKIGGTNIGPMKRLREINTTEPYRSLGPWALDDFRQVKNWRMVECDLHYVFRSKLVREPVNQKELFRIAPSKARERLESLRPEQLVGKSKVDRLFQEAEFARFLMRLFSFSGLLNWLHAQEAWAFVLFPRTSGGRHYTINIGRHEVAFAAQQDLDGHGAIFYHSIVMDRLICDFPKVVRWVTKHGGTLRSGVYASALPRAISAGFSGTFDDALEFLSLEGVRRALIAYWHESLTVLEERGSRSVFARHHNWNAVAELRRRMTSEVKGRSPR